MMCRIDGIVVLERDELQRSKLYRRKHIVALELVRGHGYLRDQDISGNTDATSDTRLSEQGRSVDDFH